MKGRHLEGSEKKLGFLAGCASVTPLHKVVTARKSIDLGVFFAGTEIEDIFVRVEDEGPADLSTGEDLGGVEVLEVLVIAVDLDRMWGALEVVSPDLEAIDDGEEFLIVDIVVAFGWDHLAGVESDGV